MSEGRARGEIARMAREVQESIGQFARLDELLGSALPRLADPGRDEEFNAAVKDVTERLDEMAVHQLAMLLSELWLYWNTTEPARAATPPVVPARPPSPVEALTSHDRSVLPAVMEEVVNLASYVGTAAIGGVIGNRADAAVQRMLDGARKRWRARRRGPDTPLDKEEALEVMAAATAIRGNDAGDLLSAEFREDGTWLFRLRADGRTMTLVVPPGDPGRARVIIRLS